MASRVFEDHLKRVESRLQRTFEAQAMAFAAACAERLWPVYERAAAGKEWDRRGALRAALDAVWSWLLAQGARPGVHVTLCEAAVDVFDEVEMRDDSDSGGRHVATAAYGLLASIAEAKQHRGQALMSAQTNLDLIDAFLYEYLELEVSDDSDRTVNDHELMVLERGRQERDLAAIEQWAGTATVTEVRQRATGVIILGQHWYS